MFNSDGPHISHQTSRLIFFRGIGQSWNIIMLYLNLTLLTFLSDVSPLKGIFADMRAISVTLEKDKLLRDATTIDSISIIGTNKHRLAGPFNSL